jgi:hypothetical protein
MIEGFDFGLSKTEIKDSETNIEETKENNNYKLVSEINEEYELKEIEKTEEIEEKKDLIDDSYELHEIVSNIISQSKQEELDEVDQKKEDLENYQLEDFSILKILGITKLQPMVIYAEIEDTGNKKGIITKTGIPVFFNEDTNEFVLADIKPLKINNLSTKLEDFLKEKKG